MKGLELKNFAKKHLTSIVFCVIISEKAGGPVLASKLGGNNK